MPLKPADEIYNFFEESGKEFIGIVPNETDYSVRHVRFYHPFLHNRIYRNSKPLKAFDQLMEFVQKFCGVNRLRDCNWKIIDGWQWFSITSELCTYTLRMEDEIRKRFTNTIASDELVMQTLAYNSEFMERLYDAHDKKRGSMRDIDWKRGKPYVWGQDEKDFEMLMDSPYMFARKFDEQHFEIVEKIFHTLDQKNKAEEVTSSGTQTEK